jgi:hypothetical protein
MSEQPSNLQRNKTLTVLALLVLIVIGIIIGALAVANGGADVIFPPNSFAKPHDLLALLTQVGAAL